MRKFLICCLSCVLTFTVFAQKDSNTSMQSFPSESAASVVKKHSPKKAALLSAIIPGTGQIYNGSWWKTPFVYAGFAGVGYGLYFYQDYYTSFKTAYDDYRDPFLEQGLFPPNDTVLTVLGEIGYSPTAVQQGRDHYRKYRDLCIIGIGVWYMVNILDAYVEAHLFEFDVSDDLTIQWQPAYFTAYGTKPTPLPTGVRISMQF